MFGELPCCRGPQGFPGLPHYKLHEAGPAGRQRDIEFPGVVERTERLTAGFIDAKNSLRAGDPVITRIERERERQRFVRDACQRHGDVAIGCAPRSRHGLRQTFCEGRQPALLSGLN